MIDLHCHLLPGIDDGPPTMEDTIALAQAAVASGTTTIVATPHVHWDWPANDARLIAAKVEEVRAALHAADVELEVLTGAEIGMTRAADLSAEELVALRLGGGTRGGRYLLVECPLSPSAAGFDRVLDRLQHQGHDILLAHPERCPAFQKDPAALEALVARGMQTQITAGALVGRFGKAVQRYAEQLVRDGLGHLTASDAHSVERRPPTFGPDTTAAGLDAEHFAQLAPAAILAGRPIPLAPARPKRGLGRLLGRA